MGTVVVPLPSGDIAINTEGRIDCNAERAFTRGQCHALALALHQLTGWTMCGLFTSSERRRRATPGHVIVRHPDGRYIDVTGDNALGNWRQYWKESEPYPVTKRQVLGYELRDYQPPNVEAALPYARTLLAKYGDKAQEKQARPISLVGIQTRFPFAYLDTKEQKAMTREEARREGFEFFVYHLLCNVVKAHAHYTALALEEAPFKAQARQIATMYNHLAETEARPDLEETQ